MGDTVTVNGPAIAAKTLAAIERVGRTVTLTNYADTYSTATGKTTRTPTNYTITASPPYQKDRRSGADAQPRGSAAMVIPALNLTAAPAVGSKIVTGGISYTVTAVTTHEIASTTLAYELDLQQGAPS